MARTEAYPEAADPAWLARQVLRAGRVGSLATSANGQPYASLVTPACTPDLSVLLLLSGLSEHTRHLMADPRCSVLVASAAAEANPQTTPRLTVTGEAEAVARGDAEEPILRARYLAVHPYAALYVDFGDFAIWRLKPAAALWIGGFGRARRLTPQALLPEPEAVAAIAAAEARIIEHCNNDHPVALAAIAGSRGNWRMVTADVDGFDLARDDQVLRFAWSAPVRTPGDVRREMVRLSAAGRG